MNYKNQQCAHAEKLIEDGGGIFSGDKGRGLYRERRYAFILQDGKNNIYSHIRQEACEYFELNKIGWWGGRGPSNHTLSSQIACINHLFPIRRNKKDVLAMVRKILPDIEDVLTITTDKFNPAYIQFEAVSDADHLNESKSTRGSNCTSIDALIWAELKNGRKIILVIEWKYTESYAYNNLAMGDPGKTRKRRYSDLIGKSNQLSGASADVYYFEPFYQLMRQTLWAEQMLRYQQTETVKADDFLHIHVIPKENHALLGKPYGCSGKGMEETWRDSIKDQHKYIIISPSELLSPIDRKSNQELLCYLQDRYW